MPAKLVKKLYEGRPNILDSIANGEITLIVNTPSGSKVSAQDDSYIRKSAIKSRVCYFTTMAAAQACVSGILEVQEKGDSGVRSIQEFHKSITE